MTHADGTAHDRAPAVSVVIATYNRPRGIAAAVGALETQTFEDFELVVVDQCADPSVERLLAESPLQTQYVQCLTPVDGPRVTAAARRGKVQPSNASRARNTGVLAARADLVCFTDDDCEPAQDWVDKITLPLRSETDVLMVTGPRAIWQTWPEVRVTYHAGRQNPSVSVWQGGTSSLAFRRDEYLSLGGLDTSIGPGTPVFGAEDQHLIYRFLAHAGDTGGRVANRRDAAVQDTLPGTRRQWLRKRLTYMRCMGMMLRRETLTRDDRIAREVFEQYLSRQTRRGIESLVRARQPLWLVTTPMQAIALLTGWVQGGRLAGFVPEIGPEDAAR